MNNKKYLSLITLMIMVFLLTSCGNFEDSKAVKNSVSLDENREEIEMADIKLNYNKDFTVLSKENEESVKNEVILGLKKIRLEYENIFDKSLEDNNSFILINTDKQEYPSVIVADVSKKFNMKFAKKSEKDTQENLIKVLEATYPERTQKVKIANYTIDKINAPLIFCDSEYSKEDKIKLKSARTAFIYKSKLYKFIFTTTEDRFDEEFKEFEDLLNSIELK